MISRNSAGIIEKVILTPLIYERLKIVHHRGLVLRQSNMGKSIAACATIDPGILRCDRR